MKKINNALLNKTEPKKKPTHVFNHKIKSQFTQKRI